MDKYYKYGSIDRGHITRTRMIFKDSRIYFCHRAQFNDPFDCHYRCIFKGTAEEKKRFLINLYNKMHPISHRNDRRLWVTENIKKFNDKKNMQSIIDKVDDTISKIGIYCLTYDNKNILMWSHYANNHTGYCIEFSDDYDDMYFSDAFDVEYSEEYPVLNFTKDSDEERFKKTILTKSIHWDYEKECRKIRRHGCGVFEYPESALKGVIFGCKMSDCDKEKIIKWCKKRKNSPIFYQARMSDRNYSLDIDIFNP